MKKQSNKKSIILIVVFAVVVMFGWATVGIIKYCSDLKYGLKIARSRDDVLFHPTEADISVDEENCYVFYKNLLVVFTTDDLSKSKMIRLARKFDGEIVGKVSGGMHEFQMKVDADTTEELGEIAAELMEYDEVIYASFDVPCEIDFFTVEPENTQVVGTNSYDDKYDWWAQDIGAYDAWMYDESRHKVTVGVIDSGFDLDNNELKGHIEYADFVSDEAINEADKLDESDIGHGTAVAGFIAAADNDIGIRGVASDTELLCVPMYDAVGNITFDAEDTIAKNVDEEIDNWNDEQEVTYPQFDPETSGLCFVAAVEKLLEEGKRKNNGLSIINMSMGVCFYQTGYKVDDDITITETPDYQYNMHARECVLSMIVIGQLHEAGYDFVIVQAGQNGLNNDGTARVNIYLMGPFGFVSKDAFDFLLPESAKEKLYDMGVGYEEIKSHLLTVGSTSNSKAPDGKYYVADKSTIGMSIVAPGECANGLLHINPNNAYGYGSGNSYAAPIVSGSLAYLMSLDPSITAVEARQLILDTAQFATGHKDTTTDEMRDYPMLDLAAAAKAVMKHRYEGAPLPIGKDKGKDFPFTGKILDTGTMFGAILNEANAGVDDVVSCIYKDFDEDGDFETFILLGQKTEDESYSEGDLWFGTVEKGFISVRKLEESRKCKVLENGQVQFWDKYIGEEKAYNGLNMAAYIAADGSSMDVWLVVDNEPVKVRSNGVLGLEYMNVDAFQALKDFPKKFYLSSGSGAWATELLVEKDGSFRGLYYDYDAGSALKSNFSGEFTDFEQIDEFTYKMHLKDYNQVETPGKVYSDHTGSYVGANGFDSSILNNDFYLYLPGKDTSTLPDSFLVWTDGWWNEDQRPDIMPFYAIYNEAGSGFMEDVNGWYNGLNFESEETEDTEETGAVDTEIPDGLVDFLKSLEPVFGSFDFPTRTFSYEDPGKNLLAGIFSLPGTDYSQWPYNGELLTGDDPLGKLYTLEGYVRIPEQNMNWILENIYNLSSDDIKSMCDLVNSTAMSYYKDGYYYDTPQFGEGWLEMEKIITDIEDKNGYYFVTFYDYDTCVSDVPFDEISNPDDSMYCSKHTAVVKKKSGPNGDYWSVYYYDVPFEQVNLQ